MFNTFKIKAEGVSAEVHRFPSKTGAMAFILAFLKKEEVRESPGSYALWASCPFLEGIETQSLTEAVPGLLFEVTRQRAAEARIGISQMDWGLADTGTLVQDATAVEQRLVSTLPAIHLALLETGKILPDLPAVLEKINPEESPYLAMITGPSRTADIERVLTIGVHGPVRVVIVCIDEAGGAI